MKAIQNKNKKLYLSKSENLKIIISSPSGAGKTTVTKQILKKIRNSYLSVSCTTRDPRPGEKNGLDYNFVNKLKFIKLKNELMKSIPINRLGSGEDIANAVLFLASNKSDYITGETIHVNGGMYMA